jgi:hypothetical protein
MLSSHNGRPCHPQDAIVHVKPVVVILLAVTLTLIRDCVPISNPFNATASCGASKAT